MKLKIIIFTNDDIFGDPGTEIVGTLFFDASGDIIAHCATDALYAYAFLLVAPMYQGERPSARQVMLARRSAQEGLDPSVAVSRFFMPDRERKEAVEAERRAWERWLRTPDTPGELPPPAHWEAL